jgi:hypothetical protein
MEYIINHLSIGKFGNCDGRIEISLGFKMEINGNCWELPSSKQEDGQPSNPVDHSLRAAPRAVSP